MNRLDRILAMTADLPVATRITDRQRKAVIRLTEFVSNMLQGQFGVGPDEISQIEKTLTTVRSFLRTTVAVSHPAAVARAFSPTPGRRAAGPRRPKLPGSARARRPRK